MFKSSAETTPTPPPAFTPFSVPHGEACGTPAASSPYLRGPSLLRRGRPTQHAPRRASPQGGRGREPEGRDHEDGECMWASVGFRELAFRGQLVTATPQERAESPFRAHPPKKRCFPSTRRFMDWRTQRARMSRVSQQRTVGRHAITLVP